MIPRHREIDFNGHTYWCRLVASLHISDPMAGETNPDETIWYHDAEGVDFFFLVNEAEEPRRQPLFFTTLRKAFSQACKNGGWG